MLNKYEVIVTEFREKVVYIEADSKDEAEKRADKLYSDGDIVLDCDDCVSMGTEVTRIATEEEIQESSWRPVFKKESAKQ